MTDSSLFDMLAIIIAFSGVMLTLSMIVTALVQAVSSYWNVRGKNLQRGLAELLETAANEDSAYPLIALEREADQADAVESAADAVLKRLIKNNAPAAAIATAASELTEAIAAGKILKQRLAKAATLAKAAQAIPDIDYTQVAVEVLNGNQVLKPAKGKFNRISRWFFPEPETTWVTKEELRRLLTENQKFPNGHIENAMDWFSRMELGLSQRFLGEVRLITVVVAIFVAFLVQVNTPELLIRLSRDAEYRDAAVAVAEEVNRRAPEWSAMLASYRDIAPEALDKLAKMHPDVAARIEEVGGEGMTLRQHDAELRLALGDWPDVEQVAKDYEGLLVDAYKTANAVAIDAYQQGMKELSLIDISVWSRGWSYYTSNGWNLLGVLITAILISFGAPFWFKVLQSTINLRDALQRPTEKEKKEGKEKESSAGTP